QLMVGHLEGRFLQMLVALLKPMHVREIRTLTGCSALSMADAPPEGGRIITLEMDAPHARGAQEHIDTTPLADRHAARLGHAMDSLAQVRPPIDLAFLDADKSNYLRYYEATLPLLAPGGFIVADNVLWSGRVNDPEDESEDTVALREFNRVVSHDERVEC